MRFQLVASIAIETEAFSPALASHWICVYNLGYSIIATKELRDLCRQIYHQIPFLGVVSRAARFRPKIFQTD